MRSMVEGFSGRRKNPSTALRAVPLPGKCRGGIWERRTHRHRGQVETNDVLLMFS